MKFNLFVDVETTGLWQKYVPATSLEQPQIVQLAAILTAGADAKPIVSFNVYTHITGQIPPAATEIHHITDAILAEQGIPIVEALMLLTGMADVATRNNGTLIGHNIDYDANVILNSYARNLCDATIIAALPHYCTMRAATNHCKIPGKFGGKYKWPKLAEAYAILCGKPMPAGAHNAIVDLTCTIELCKALSKLPQL